MASTVDACYFALYKWKFIPTCHYNGVNMLKYNV